MLFVVANNPPIWRKDKGMWKFEVYRDRGGSWQRRGLRV